MAKTATKLLNLGLQITNVEQMCTGTHTQNTTVSALFPFRGADIFEMASAEVFCLMNLPKWKMRFYSMDRNLQNIGVDCRDIRPAPGLHSE